jgi:hypothetical protein
MYVKDKKNSIKIYNFEANNPCLNGGAPVAIGPIR